MLNWFLTVDRKPLLFVPILILLDPMKLPKSSTYLSTLSRADTKSGVDEHYYYYVLVTCEVHGNCTRALLDAPARRHAIQDTRQALGVHTDRGSGGGADVWQVRKRVVLRGSAHLPLPRAAARVRTSASASSVAPAKSCATFVICLIVQAGPMP